MIRPALSALDVSREADTRRRLMVSVTSKTLVRSTGKP